MNPPGLVLDLLPGRHAVCRLAADLPVPDWALAPGAFASITRTVEELSIVCPEAAVPPGTQAEKGLRILKVRGVLEFSLTGILASIALPLAAAEVSIFAVSTFDTDYVLVPAATLEAALGALRAAGHTVGVG